MPKSIRSYLFGLLFVPKVLFGQFIGDNERLKVYDTLAIIETVQLQDSSVKISFKNFMVMFDKQLTVETIRADIEELKSKSALKDWQSEYINQLERVTDFISQQKTLSFINFWTQTDAPVPIDEIKDDHLLTKEYLWELVCPMIDRGELILLYKNQEKTRIFKTNAGNSFGTAVTYLTSDGESFWVCPPITID